jgi:iron complex transport system substrate-binding protein
MSASSHRSRLLLAIAVVLPLLAGCAAPAGQTVAPSASAAPTTAPTPVATPTATPAAAFPVELTDDEGTAVALASAPQKIVSLTPATTEILFKLGAGPRVVATTDFDDYPPEAVALPHVASYTAVDVEKIVGLGADLVIAGGNSFNDPAAIRQLRDLHVPVVVVYARDLDGVLKDIELIGQAVGGSDAATALTATMRAGFQEVADATKALDHPRVFYELDATNGLYTAAKDSVYEEMIRLAGGDPITTDSPTDFSISLEKVIAADPQIILLGDAAYGVTADAVKARPGWGVITAVKTSAIRGVNDLIITRPGPRLVDGLRELARAIHPEAAIPSPEPTAAPSAPASPAASAS